MKIKIQIKLFDDNDKLLDNKELIQGCFKDDDLCTMIVSCCEIFTSNIIAQQLENGIQPSLKDLIIDSELIDIKKKNAIYLSK